MSLEGYIGDFPTGAIFHKLVDFFASGVLTEPASLTLAAYKNNSETQTTTGVTVSDTSFDTLGGVVLVTIDCSDAFYAAGSEISIIATAGTLEGTSQIGRIIFSFSVERTGGALALMKNFVNTYLDTLVGPQVTVVADGGNTAQTFKTNLAQIGTDHWKDAWLSFDLTTTTTALRGQTKPISAFNPTTDFVTMRSAFTQAPAAGDTARLVTR